MATLEKPMGGGGNTFVALTALSEFWDLEADKIVFLGDWCVTYGNKNIVEKTS